MPLTLYLLRHGQTPFSRDDLFCGSGLDPELTVDGVAMAEAFAHSYARIGFQAIFASPLARTLAMAEPVSSACGLAVETRDGLREIAYGAWEGKTKSEVERTFHDDYVRWSADPAWNAPTGGERAVEIARRASQVVEELKNRCAEGPVLSVSHKATIRILVCHLLGVDVGRFRDRFACDVGSVTVVEFGRQGPKLLALGDRSHLPEELRRLPGT